MKNVQIIDGADNATYSIFQATEEEFAAIFPKPGQDLEVVGDLVARLGEHEAANVLEPLWTRPIRKADIAGLHGTLFYNYVDTLHQLPATRREADRDPSQFNSAQRTMFKAEQLRTRAEGPAHT